MAIFYTRGCIITVQTDNATGGIVRPLGGVSMGKLAPARVSYRDDFVISYHVYMMTGSFHHPTSNVLKLTQPSWIDKNYTCATRSSLPANWFHTETSGRFAFTWYRCKISYGSEILAPVREQGELMLGQLAPAWHFVVVSCKQMYSYERKPEWTRPSAKVAPLSCKHPLTIKKSTRSIIRLNEAYFEMHLEWRRTKRSSSRWIMCLVPVFILEEVLCIQSHYLSRRIMHPLV